MCLSGACVEGPGGRLDVRRECLNQIGLGANLLLRVAYTKCFIEDRVKLNLTPPPVVVVLARLPAKEEPTVVDLAFCADNGDAGALRDTKPSLLFIRKLVPLVDRKLQEHHTDLACRLF